MVLPAVIAYAVFVVICALIGRNTAFTYNGKEVSWVKLAVFGPFVAMLAGIVLIALALLAMALMVIVVAVMLAIGVVLALPLILLLL